MNSKLLNSIIFLALICISSTISADVSNNISQPITTKYIQLDCNKNFRSLNSSNKLVLLKQSNLEPIDTSINPTKYSSLTVKFGDNFVKGFGYSLYIQEIPKYLLYLSSTTDIKNDDLHHVLSLDKITNAFANKQDVQDDYLSINIQGLIIGGDFSIQILDFSKGSINFLIGGGVLISYLSDDQSCILQEFKKTSKGYIPSKEIAVSFLTNNNFHFSWIVSCGIESVINVLDNFSIVTSIKLSLLPSILYDYNFKIQDSDKFSSATSGIKDLSVDFSIGLRYLL